MTGSGEHVARAVAAALQAIAPTGVRVGARDIGADDEAALLPAERVAVRAAIPRRRAEFATGRVLLRELLGTSLAIPVAGDRRPVLPDGFVASLAHAGDIAIAAAGAESEFAAIGIDVEPIHELGADVAEHILRSDDGTTDALLGFVLKEAAYKAWSALGGGLLDHHDVRVTLDPPAFTADIDAASQRQQLAGTFCVAAGFLGALVVVAR